MKTTNLGITNNSIFDKLKKFNLFFMDKFTSFLINDIILYPIIRASKVIQKVEAFVHNFKKIKRKFL